MTRIEKRRRIARFRSLTRKVRTSTTIALWVCLTAAIGLMAASFIVPPTGEISPSALKGGSLLFAFATLMEVREAILEGFGIRLTHGDTTVVIKDQDKQGAEGAEPADEEKED